MIDEIVGIDGQGLAAMSVGVVGFGTIGRRVVEALGESLPSLHLTVIGVRNEERAREIREELGGDGPRIVVEGVHELCDIVVDCAPSDAFMSTVLPALEAGRTVITVNGTAILQHPDVVTLAERHGGRLILVSGAILGLDAVRAAAEGEIAKVTIVTRKPPKSLADAPRMIELGLDADALSEPVQMFAGSVREGALLFPANVNVAAAIALAGIGSDRTMLEVWADPALERNTHVVDVVADSARFSMSIESVPTESNPATGRLSALSVIAALRRLGEPLQVGT